MRENTHKNVNAVTHTHFGSLPKRKRQFSLVRKDKSRNIVFKFEWEAFERLEKNLTVRLTGEWNQFLERMMGFKSHENLRLLLDKLSCWKRWEMRQKVSYRGEREDDHLSLSSRLLCACTLGINVLYRHQ
jgi:hypothetical protein